METLLNTLPIIQIVLAIVLVVAILLQQRGAGLGSAFGGGDDSIANYERRGFERTLFRGTIIIAIIFVVSVIASIFVEKPIVDNTPLDFSVATSTTATTTGEMLEVITSTSTPTIIETTDAMPSETETSTTTIETQN